MYHWHNVVHFSSFFFNILFLKWIPTGIEFPSWKLKWNWRALHIQNTVWFQMCFLLLTMLRTDFLWHHSEECVHHGWGYRIGEDPSQATTTTKRKWAKENLLFVSAPCHAQLVISRGSGQGLIWGQGWAEPTLIQVSRAIQEECSGPKLLPQPNSGARCLGLKKDVLLHGHEHIKEVRKGGPALLVCLFLNILGDIVRISCTHFW